MGYNEEIIQAQKRRDQLIVSLLREKKTQHEIAAQAQCSLSTVNNVRLNYKVQGRGPGRPKKNVPTETAKVGK